jgi:hypothetical protein
MKVSRQHPRRARRTRHARPARRPKRPPQPVQLTLDLARRHDPDDKRGGARPGAGRPASARSGVPHRARPALSKHHPVHVTLRLSKEAHGVRAKKVFAAVRRALARARDQFGFRLNQYSVQRSHIHLIAEGNDRRALTRGMMGLSIRVALAINRVLGRKGRVFGDRYHARQLRTPLEVRRALLYVLRNDRHHRAAAAWSLPPWSLDICSSAREFDGWRRGELLSIALQRERTNNTDADPQRSVSEPRSQLLRSLWWRRGPLGLDEMPASP